MEQLGSALGEFQLAKQSHSVAIDTLRDDNEEMKVKLNETMAVKVELENRIEELQTDLASVRESQFFQRTPSIFDAGESEFLSPSFDEEAFTRRFDNKVQGDEEEDEVDE